jgi:hypothetical protein
LRFAVYALEKPTRLPDFSQLDPVREGIATSLDPRGIEPKLASFGLVLEGLLDVPTDDWFRLIVESDDGSRVQLHGETVIDNDGAHPAQEAGAVLRAARGLHPVRIEYFELSGDSALRLWIEHPNGQRTEVTAPTLRHR